MAYGYRYESALPKVMDRFFSNPLLFRAPDTLDRNVFPFRLDIQDGGGWAGVWIFNTLDVVMRYFRLRGGPEGKVFLSRIDLDKTGGHSLVLDHCYDPPGPGSIIVRLHGPLAPAPADGAQIDALGLPEEAVTVWDGRCWTARSPQVHRLIAEATSARTYCPPDA